MKLHILSDLHTEFADFEPPQTEADVVILAGDVHPGPRGLHWAMESFPDKPVLYVLGNHEYYGEALPKLTNKLRREAAGSHVHVLERDSVVIDGVRFLGCTLWTDFKLFGDPQSAVYEAIQSMTDYRVVRVNPRYRRLRPTDTMDLHWASKQWLEMTLDRHREETLVVITHHAPSARSGAAEYAPDLLGAAYASNLDELVANSGAKLWIHGHIHEVVDYYLGGTRVISNPRGYVPFEPAAGFRADFVVEI